MNIALKDVDISPADIPSHHNTLNIVGEDADLYTLAKTYFDLKELDR